MNTMEYYNKNVESNGTYVPVERYTDEYCKALTENYKQDTMRSYERYIMKRDSAEYYGCLLYTSPSPRDQRGSRMPGCG